METALIGVIGGVAICLLGFIITVLMATRNELRAELQNLRILIDGKMNNSVAENELRACREDKVKAWQAIDELRKQVWGGHHA